MDRVRIYIAIPTFHPLVGGAEKQALAHARSLRRRGYEATIVTFRHVRAWPRRSSVDAVPVIRVAGWAVGNREELPAPLRKLAYLIGLSNMGWVLWRHRRHYDILTVYGLGPLALPAGLSCLLTGKPMVSLLRSAGATLASGSQSRSVKARPGDMNDIETLKRYGRPLLHLTIELLRRVGTVMVVLSSRMRDEVEAHGIEMPLTLCIPNGVDVEAFAPVDDRSFDNARAKTVVCVTRLDYPKGVDVLLVAWGLVHAQDPDARLLIVGRGPLHDELVVMARELEISASVEFTGVQSDVVAQLHRAGIGVLASRWEGMPNAVLEAMACGLPCVATRVSGSEDIVQHEVNGLLVSPEDAHGLADALLTLLQDPTLARAYGRAARASIDQRYAHERIIDCYVRLYEMLSAGNSSYQISQSCAEFEP
jgi:glycosyltransferase involved in cell wall biosynthesis